MIRGDFMEENIVCVVARDKHTGYVKTCTSCDIENANKQLRFHGMQTQTFSFRQWMKQRQKS